MKSMRGRQQLCFTLLIVMTCAAYAQAINADFISFDDPRVVTKNPPVLAGLTGESLYWAWTTGHFSNWHPLTWMSLMLDVELFGQWAGGFHLTNLLIHLGSVLLLFRVASSWFADDLAALIAASLFAVHPIQVQTVMWVSERKGLLSTLFLIAFLWVYTRYRKVGEQRWYLVGLLLYVCSLLCKQMLITLPLLLLWMDQWPMRKFFRYPDDEGHQPLFDVRILKGHWLEKVPFVLLALFFAGVAYWAQSSGGALGQSEQFPLVQRLGTATASIGFYWQQLVLPWGYSFHYHNDGNLPTSRELIASLLPLAAGLGLAIRYRNGWLLFAIGWFLTALAPVSGIVQIGEHRFADRYLYVPSIGVFLAVGLGLRQFQHWLKREHRQAASLLGAAATGGVLVLVCLSYREAGFWTTSERLYRRALTLDSENPFALSNLGSIRFEQKKDAEALSLFNRAIARHPGGFSAMHNSGLVFARRGEHMEAIKRYRSALSVHPRFPQAKKHLAVSLAKTGQYEQATALFQELLELAPAHPDFLQNYAATLFQKGDFQAAADQYQILVNTELAENAVYYHYGETLANLQRWNDATGLYREYLKRVPNSIDGNVALAYSLGIQDRWREAIAGLREPMNSMPQNRDLLVTLGWVLMNVNDPSGNSNQQSAKVCQRLQRETVPEALRIRTIWCQLMIHHGYLDSARDVAKQMRVDRQRIYLTQPIKQLQELLHRSASPDDAGRHQ